MTYKKRSVIGFIITCDEQAMHAARDHGERKETLWIGRRVTAFKTRKAAKRVLANTKELCRRKGYSWPWLDRAWIYNVEM